MLRILGSRGFTLSRGLREVTSYSALKMGSEMSVSSVRPMGKAVMVCQWGGMRSRSLRIWLPAPSRPAVHITPMTKGDKSGTAASAVCRARCLLCADAAYKLP